MFIYKMEIADPIKKNICVARVIVSSFNLSKCHNLKIVIFYPELVMSDPLNIKTVILFTASPIFNNILFSFLNVCFGYRLTLQVQNMSIKNFPNSFGRFVIYILQKVVQKFVLNENELVMWSNRIFFRYRIIDMQFIYINQRPI